MKTILLTGFEPFGGDRINTSAEIVRRLDGARIEGWLVRGEILPCVFRQTQAALGRALRVARPGLVVCLGQAAGRTAVTPELVAVNHTDARLPDNAGHQPVDTAVVRGGPAAYLSGLPVRAIVAELRSRGLPAEVSRSAGGFVCNHLFYQLMHRLSRTAATRRGGFVHVPAAGTEGWTTDRLVEAIRLAVEVSVRAAEATARTDVARKRSARHRPRQGRASKTSRG